MAWIESNCDLADHPKTLDLMNYTGFDIDTVLGKLHRFWYWVLKYADDGDLRKFNDEQLGRAVELNGDKAKLWVESLVKARWLDREPYFRVHDWWDYAGRYLQGKYARKPEIWERMRALYKDENDTACKQPTSNLQATDEQQVSPNLPNLPNHTIPTTHTARVKARAGVRAPFQKPTPLEVEEYAKSIAFALDGSAFCDYYEARGWKYKGGVAMKDWRAAVRTWKKNRGENGAGKSRSYGSFKKGDNTAGQVDSQKLRDAGIPG